MSRLVRWQRALAGHRGRRAAAGIVVSAAALAAVTGVVGLLRGDIPVLSLGALYLLAVLPVAVFFGRALAVAVSIASMLV